MNESSHVQWTAAANLLASTRAEGFAFALIQRLPIRATVVVVSTETGEKPGSGFHCGGSVNAYGSLVPDDLMADAKGSDLSASLGHC